MKKSRKVRGLLDVIDEEANNEEWELETPSLDYVPGMGLGATKEATRWAWIGYNREKMHTINEQLRRSPGRPTISPIRSKNAWRAFILWGIAQKFEADKRQHLNQRRLIQIARQLEDFLQIPNVERAFPEYQDFDSSVSRGKKNLQIDEAWHSDVCEKIANL